MKRLTAKQAREESLETLCLALASTYQTDKTQIDGAVMAQLASRLIAAESQPGGPYFGPHHQIDFPTNLAIGYLFACFGQPLPGVDTYIAAHQKQATTPRLKKLLASYHAARRPKPPKKPLADTAHQAVYASAKHQLSQLSQPEKSLALAFLARIQRADHTGEIALLPTFFATTLLAPPSSPPLSQLGQANIYCWIAYSIYDKLLDDQPASQFLPVANICMRQALQIYQQLFPSSHLFHTTLHATFTAMDHANAWELANCRFQRAGESIIISRLPRYGNYAILAQRSGGHILGPLAVAIQAQLSPTAISQLEKGLRHYLIARQLSDDIHDWQEDMRAGHASSVVALLLQHLAVQPGTYQQEDIIARMQTDFWQHTMEATNTLIRRHLRLSRRYLAKSGVLKKEGQLFQLISRLEAIANSSSQEHARYQAFLETYQKG